MENSQVAQEIISRIDIYAEKLGVLTTDIFQILLAQQYVHATLDIIAFIVGIILTVTLYKFTVKSVKSAWNKSKDLTSAQYDVINARAVSLVIVTCTVGIITVIGFFTSVIPSIGHLINPTYYALQEIKALF